MWDIHHTSISISDRFPINLSEIKNIIIEKCNKLSRENVGIREVDTGSRDEIIAGMTIQD